MWTLFAIVVMVGFCVVIGLLLFCLERQRVLHKRMRHLEEVMTQAVGPELAERLRAGGSAFIKADTWIEDDLPD